MSFNYKDRMEYESLCIASGSYLGALWNQYPLEKLLKLHDSLVEPGRSGDAARWVFVPIS